ncbi:MAG: hypothetical protein HY867_20160 [Chloroflexi bacterium]|nr:hypothetical protein [Chloroflexota bacterium]
MGQDKRNEKKQVINLTSGQIQIDNDSLVMVIDKSPFYFYESLLMIGFFFLFFNCNLTLDSTGWIIILVACVLLALSLSTKRRVRCLADKNLGRVRYWRSGIMGSKINQKDIQFQVDQLKEVVMKRHVLWWWRSPFSGDTFQIGMTTKNGQWLELTSKYLDFSECQSIAEIIRNFIDPALPIKAVD